jgi:hypothetical protein
LTDRAGFRLVPVTLLFTALTLVITWPQAVYIGTRVGSHFDSYFSMWRISWIAHALATAPSQLFHANIFYPQRYALALSDPVLLEGIVAAPFLWLGASAVLTYNVLVLASFVLCGVAAAALGFALTRSHAAAVLGGTVFAFAPYRFEHYFHLELLWAFWMPLAFLGLHRALNQARVRDGVLTGLAVLGQTLSSLYYAVYLGAALLVAAPFLLRWRHARASRALAVLSMGAVLAAIVSLVYVQPLLWIRSDVAGRTLGESAVYSATWASFFSAHRDIWLYGWTADFSTPELRLFPGIAALVLGAIGVRRGGRTAWAYAAVLIFAVLAAMGSNAPLFGSLRQVLDPYSMVRVPARFAAVGLCALAVLASLGAASVLARAADRQRAMRLATLIGVVMVAEYAARPSLMEVPLEPEPAYQWLRDQPPGPLVELPFPELRGLPGDEARRQYYSTMHWQPLLNGYSGYYPLQYFSILSRRQVFPRGGWIDRYMEQGARYFFIHEAGFDDTDLVTALERLEAHPDLIRIGRFTHDADAVWVYAERRTQGLGARD